MASPFLIASFVAIIPAMLMMWWVLRHYTDFFDEKAVFFTIAVGLFVGIVIAAFEIMLFGFQFVELQDALNGWGSFVWVVGGYALFESGSKSVVLGLQRFKNHGDGPYYGLSLGIAAGAMIAVQLIAFALRAGEAIGNPYSGLPMVTMFLAPIGAIAAHGASAVWIAKGASQGKLGAGWARGMVLQMPALACLWFWWQDAGAGNAAVVGPGIASLAYGALILYLANRRVLSQLVPAELRDQVRREQRRQARAAARGKPVDSEE